MNLTRRSLFLTALSPLLATKLPTTPATNKGIEHVLVGYGSTEKVPGCFFLSPRYKHLTAQKIPCVLIDRARKNAACPAYLHRSARVLVDTHYYTLQPVYAWPAGAVDTYVALATCKLYGLDYNKTVPSLWI